MISPKIVCVDSYYVRIHIAGDYAQAKQTCRQFCYERGLCVGVTAKTYVYRGGEEEGVVVELVNYPRFPISTGELWVKAVALAEELRRGLCQLSFLLESPDKTRWFSYRPEDTASPKNNGVGIHEEL